MTEGTMRPAEGLTKRLRDAAANKSNSATYDKLMREAASRLEELEARGEPYARLAEIHRLTWHMLDDSEHDVSANKVTIDLSISGEYYNALMEIIGDECPLYLAAHPAPAVSDAKPEPSKETRELVALVTGEAPPTRDLQGYREGQAAMREMAAKVCDSIRNNVWYSEDTRSGAERLAYTIRALPTGDEAEWSSENGVQHGWDRRKLVDRRKLKGVPFSGDEQPTLHPTPTAPLVDKNYLRRYDEKF